MITKKDLFNKNLELIPVSEVEITLDENETIGYDLTVEDYYTFASHDGVFVQDTMAIYHPITNEAQEEVKQRMMRSESGANDDSVSFEISKEMAVGVFALTKDVRRTSPAIAVTDKDFENANDPYIPVKYRGQTTTMGRAIFNSVFPADYPFFNGLATKKIVNDMIPVVLKKYGQEQAIESFSKLKDYAFKFATISSPTITLDDIQLPPEILELKNKLDNATTEEAAVLLDEMLKLLIKHLKDTGLYDLIESGAGKGWKQPMQLLVAKGLIADPTGKVLPAIKGSFADGLTNKEYFSQAAGARKGIIDRVLNTAETGYMARKLAYVLNSVEIDRTLKDCKTTRTLDLRLTKRLSTRLKGRYVIKGDSVEQFTNEKFNIGDRIHLRSPIFCESPKLCHTCYGDLLKRHKSPYAGIMASQLIGEAGTQTIMKCADGLVHYNGNMVPFKDLFDEGYNYNKDGDIETVDFNNIISGKNGKVKASVIQRHPAHDDMLFFSTKNGCTMICQQNHPLWIKETSIHNKFDNSMCDLIGDQIYTEKQSTRKTYLTENDNVIEMIASDIKENDFIWIDTIDARENTKSIIPPVSGYIAGIYCAEGCEVGKDRRVHQNRICQSKDSPIKDRVYEACKKEFVNKEFEQKVTYTKDGVQIWDSNATINSIIKGDHAWEKRIKSDFINYHTEWLKEFLSGVIDGDGSVFTEYSTCCRIYTTSYYLVQQLTAICAKLGYKFNTCLGAYNEKYGRVRTYFQFDIRFFEDPNLSSIKFNSVVFKPSLRRKDKIGTRGFDRITKIKKIPRDSWKYPVYDVKTETKEFLLGMVQNHNTFHTGGAVDVVKRDIVGDIVQNDPLANEGLVRKLITQDENVIACKEDCTITLSLADYPLPGDLKFNDEETTLSAKAIVSRIEFDNAIFNVILDYPVNIQVYEYEKVNKEYIKLFYKKNSTIIEVPTETAQTKAQIQYVERLIGGREIYKGANHLFLKLFNIYGPLKNMDSVHLEVLLSQALRDKKNPSIPARLGSTWDPTMINIKQIVFKTSFIQGLAFENINEAIKTGLVTEEGGDPSILEKILTGDLAEGN